MTFCFRENLLTGLCTYQCYIRGRIANSMLKSIGLDGTSQQVLKDTSDMIVRMLSFLKKVMVFGREGWVPDGWADATSNFKKGQKENLGKCRLISAISVLRKIWEQIHFWSHEGQVAIRSSQQMYQSESWLQRWSRTKFWAALKEHSQQVEAGW